MLGMGNTPEGVVPYASVSGIVQAAKNGQCIVHG